MDNNVFTRTDSSNTYFDEEIYKRIDDEVFIDCGACSGGTYETFIKKQSG